MMNCLKKKIWGKVSCSDGESVYNEQYLKTKTKHFFDFF